MRLSTWLTALLVLTSCNVEVTEHYGLMGDSHHVLIAPAIVHEFLARDAAPTLHFMGGYIGLQCGDGQGYLLPRIQQLSEKGLLTDINRLILFVGTNDLGSDEASCIQALHSIRQLMPRLLIVGPTQLSPESTLFYLALDASGFDFIDTRGFERPEGDVHLTQSGYQQLAHEIYLRVRP